jgi:selenide,water dikinase
MFGRIAFCNVVSDLYAMGITKIHEVLMILGVSTEMTDQEKDVSTTLMINGFVEAAVQAETQVGGGQTVYNMWPMMGGAAISVLDPEDFVMPNGAQPGDKIILTKPLGVRLAINAMQWIKTDKIKREKVLKDISESQLLEAYYRAEEGMATLSLVGAGLIRKYKAHACTDVTGFGILGHANYLAQAQLNNVTFVLNRFPIYKHLIHVDKKVVDYKFMEGYTAETSGGLLICLPPSQCKQFMEELKSNGIDSW